MSRNMLQEIAYELYKQDWIDSHTTAEERLQSLQEYYDEFLDGEYPYGSYEEYLEERGFGGNIYACFPEFLDAEYQDEGYMRHLLGNDLYGYFKEEHEFEEEER